jgi:cytochrome bd-type quinol oxidase subunit 2
MPEDDRLRRDLLARIEQRRAGVQAFLRANRPRIRRRANVTIVLSSLAAVFTAGPALGGVPFAESVQNSLGLSTESIVWRVLCLAAMLVSVGAAVMTNIAKSQDAEARLSTVEAVNAELDGLASLLHYGHLSVDDAVKLYQQYTAKVPFVEDVPAYSHGTPPYPYGAPQGRGQQ